MSCSRSSGNEKRYDLKGKVVIVEPEKHLVTIAHEEIKGYMPGMTMPFTVRNESDSEMLAAECGGHGNARRRWFAFVVGEPLRRYSRKPVVL